MKTYQDYSTSELEWLDAVPGHWELHRNKYLFREVNERTETGDETLFSLTKERGLIDRSEVTDREAMASTLEGYKICRPGDLVMNRMQAWNGMFGFAEEVGLVSPDYSVYRPSDHINSRYYEYLFSTPLYIDAFQRRSKGVGSGFLRLYTPDFHDIRAIVPPRSEQDAIASHLDEKTADIDAYIAKKRGLVDLLETQRRAVVNRAVTKGLDDDVEMRDSGVEWLGEIPAHWEEIRLRYATSYVTSGSRGWGKYYDENGHALFVRIGNLRRDSIDLDLSDTEYLTLPENAEGKRTRLQEGDVLLSITADIGSVGVVPGDLGEAYVNQHVALTRPRRDLVEPRWMGYALLSGMGRPQLRSQLYGGTKDGLSLADVKDVTLYVPPLAEQKRIVEHIDAQTADIDAAIERTEQQIDLMQQYRTSLVTEVVTGAVDVRAEVAAA